MFDRQCAACHGVDGVGGVAGGELLSCAICSDSAALFEAIRDTMPLGQPESCDDQCSSLLTNLILSDFSNQSGSGAGVSPVADASLSSNLSGVVPLPVNFDASRSSDDTGIVSWFWDFGDGRTGNGEQVFHVYGTAGTYQATLTVTDDEGLTDSVFLSVSVGIAQTNQAPVAAISVSLLQGEVPFQVNFDGSGSADDIAIVQYSWNFGNGATASGETASYEFVNPGTYIVHLTVSDAEGLQNSATVTVIATEPEQILSISDAYQANCSRCHGPQGEGLFGPALTSPTTRDELLANIARMPADGAALDCGAIQNCREGLADFILANFVNREDEPVVLANPLRRLSQSEYLFALQDLFAGMNLPALTVPGDDAVDGFKNNWQRLSPSELLISEYFENSREIVEAIEGELDEFIPCGGYDTVCARQFIEDFGRRAWRRPLENVEVNSVLSLYEDVSDDASFRVATQLTIQYFLMSSNFLYRPEFGTGAELNAFEKASRLSFFIWQSIPDDTLLNAAESGGLDTLAGMEQQLDRMLSSPLARRGVREFFRHWLMLDKLDNVVKNPSDNFNDDVKAALKESVLNFAWNELYLNNLPITGILTSNRYYLNNTIAAYFDANSSSASQQAQDLPASQRQGILSHPAFLAAHGYGDYPSPVLRGVYVLDRLLCSPPNPPPPGIGATPPGNEGDTPVTNREIYQAGTSDRGNLCASCHNVINPLGFSLEIYDTVGRFRTTDNGFDIDSTGMSMGFEFMNAIDLSTQIAGSSNFSECIVEKFLKFGLGGWSVADDPQTLDDVEQSLLANNYRTRDLIKAIVMHPNFSQLFYPPQ